MKHKWPVERWQWFSIFSNGDPDLTCRTQERELVRDILVLWTSVWSSITMRWTMKPLDRCLLTAWSYRATKSRIPCTPETFLCLILHIVETEMYVQQTPTPMIHCDNWEFEPWFLLFYAQPVTQLLNYECSAKRPGSSEEDYIEALHLVLPVGIPMLDRSSKGATQRPIRPLSFLPFLPVTLIFSLFLVLSLGNRFIVTFPTVHWL